MYIILRTWEKECAAPMPTLVMPQMNVPAEAKNMRFRTFPADPTKGVATACRAHQGPYQASQTKNCRQPPANDL